MIFPANLLTQLLRMTRVERELGGLLIGNRDTAAQTVRVLGFLIPRQTRSHSTFCEFDMYWIGLARAALMSCDLYPAITIIAWLHTHPGLSVFLSKTDIRTLNRLQELHTHLLAVVLDPFRNEFGAYFHERKRRDVAIEFTDILLDDATQAALRRLDQCEQMQGFYKRAFAV